MTSVTDFEIVPGECSRIPELLLKHAPQFRQSAHFPGLDSGDWQLPGVVLGQFGIYLQDLVRNSESVEQPEVGAAVDAVERLAHSSDPRVRNAVVVEVLEHLHLEPEELDALRQLLGPTTTTLLNEWVLRQDP